MAAKIPISPRKMHRLIAKSLNPNLRREIINKNLLRMAKKQGRKARG